MKEPILLRSSIRKLFLHKVLPSSLVILLQEPNAAPQPRPEAGATEERTLEGVGCRQLFGAE